MIVDQGNPLNPQNSFWWSEQFRRTLGFKDEHDFPNIMSSWSDRLHPEDKQPALDAFSAHLLDFFWAYAISSRLSPSIKIR
ncbi:PAS domain-containing protein [Lysinibacillus sp. MHQ-1]|nr:PAS domain-containing protein [Lysinibacillus sp. MHQ-1]